MEYDHSPMPYLFATCTDASDNQHTTATPFDTITADFLRTINQHDGHYSDVMMSTMTSHITSVSCLPFAQA